MHLSHSGDQMLFAMAADKLNQVLGDNHLAPIELFVSFKGKRSVHASRWRRQLRRESLGCHRYLGHTNRALGGNDAIVELRARTDCSDDDDSRGGDDEGG